MRLRHHDLETDALLSDEPSVALDLDSVVVVDGSSCSGQKAAPHWDWVIFVEATREASAARQVVRDGAPADPSDPYHARYFGGYDIYQERLDPASPLTSSSTTPIWSTRASCEVDVLTINYCVTYST